MKNILNFLFVCSLIFTISCKKDSDTDKVSTQTIHGQVYNLCTDSGMANITVYLQENGNSIAQKVSDVNGNFSFSNMQIHSNSDYQYNLYIPSKSGIGDVGFDAGETQVDKNKLSVTFILGVVPHAKLWHIYLPAGTNITVNDTFTLTIQQNILYKNNKGFGTEWQIIDNFPPPPQPPYPSNYIDVTYNYCMGWWNTKLDKIKNGVHIIKTDSFYVGYGATVTDTIPWQ